MKLFPIPQLQTSQPVTDGSDFWEGFELIQVKDELNFPKDKEKSPEEQAYTDNQPYVSSIRYGETKLRAEGQLFTQRDLEKLGVTSRPITDCPFSIYFPMYLIRGSVLKQHARILKHEDLLAENLLLEVREFSYVNLRVETTATPYVQDPDDERVQNFGVFLPVLSSGKILKPWKRIIFISHRWLNPLGSPSSPPHPDDDENTKLQYLREIIQDDDYVILDYMSFPQQDLNLQDKAIDSLFWYIYHCSHFRVISPDARSFEEYLGRGWCQMELLSAFCPVLSITDEKSDGNFYMNYEDTRINKYYECAAPDRAVLLANGDELPLHLAAVKNPKYLNFTIPEDLGRIQGLLNTVTAAFKQSRPRKEKYESDAEGRMTTSHTVTETIIFNQASADEVEALVKILSS
jgi:hypothetical protein